MARMSVNELFSELEDRLTRKSKSLFGGDNDSLQLLRRLKKEVTAQLDASVKIMRDRDSILSSADNLAKAIISQAKAQVEQSDEVANARIRADEIIQTAVKKQNEVMRNFAMYIDTKLGECEKALQATLDSIKADRTRLFSRE